MEKFKKLKVWEKAHQLVLDVYKLTKRFPKEEIFCLVPQMRRAAISVVANIVESTKRATNKDRRHFHIMAITSLEELKYYLILSHDLAYIEKSIFENIFNETRIISAMLSRLNKSLN